MSTGGRGSTAIRAGSIAAATSDAPRRPSLALQPFAWSGLQILPVSPSAAELVAVIPPALPGMHRTAPFRVSEYDKRSRGAVTALEAALGLGELERSEANIQQAGRVGINRDMDPDLDEDLRRALDLTDLCVPVPPGISLGCRAPTSKAQGHHHEEVAQGGIASAQQPAESPGGPAEGEQHVQHSPQPQRQPPQQVNGERAENHHRAEPSSDRVGRPAKRRRVAPARYTADNIGSPSQPRPGQQAATVAATAAESAEDLTAVERQSAQQATPQRATRGGGRGGKAKLQLTQRRKRSQPQQQRGEDSVIDINDTLAILPKSAAAAGESGDGRSLPDYRGGAAEQQSQPQQQQQEEDEQEKEQQALEWWEHLSAAAPKLKSLKGILQSASGPRGEGRGRQQQLQSQTQDTSAGPQRLGSWEPRAGGDQELYEEVEREEKARQRRVVGKADDDNQGDRRRSRRGGTTGAAAGMVIAGAYGIAAEPHEGDGGDLRPLRRLPAAAAASWERIMMAVNGLPQPMRPWGAPPDDGQHQKGAGREELREGEERKDLSLQDELVLWVAVCGPGQPQVLHEEFLVLGSQYLSELRDVLGCATEDAMEQAAQAARTAGGGSVSGGFGGCHGDSDGDEGSAEPDHVRKNCGRAGAGGTETNTAARGGRGARVRQRPLKGRNPGSGRSERQFASPPPVLVAATLRDGMDPIEGHGSAGIWRSAADQAPLAGGGQGSSGDGLPVGLSGGRITTAMRAAAEDPTSLDAGKPARLMDPPSPSGALLPPSYGSYLFVEGHFYSDVRHPEAEDYTAPIRELCSAHGVRPVCLRPERGWRPTLARHPGGPLPGPAKMHTTRFYDLTLRQSNHPTGIFCHRACCEHVMFVRDVRRWHSGDPTRRSSFPVRLRARDRAGAPVARRRCGLCEARYAELVTHDDPLAPSNPAIMCRQCFDLLHIGSNGERLAPYVIVQPYNPAIDIVAPGIWALSAGSWAASNAAAASTAGVGGND